MRLLRDLWATSPRRGMAFAVLVVLADVRVLRVAGPLRRIGPAREREEEAWSGLAAVMEESIHGQDDVRTTLGQAYVLRLFARRASQVLARGRVVFVASSKVSVIASAAIRTCIAALVVGGAWGLATGAISPER